MKISIVTVCLNSERTLGKTIESIFNQDYRAYEYIIIDGESSDSTLKIAESHRDRFKKIGVKYEIYSGKDTGIYDAMNIGISKCSGDVIAILNSDDWYERHTISTVIDYFRGNKVDIVHGDLIYHDNGWVGHYKPKDTEPSLFWKGMTLHHPTFFVRNHVYQSINYDDSYQLVADYVFVLQSKKSGFKYGYLSAPLVNMKSGGAGSAFRKRIVEGHRARKEAGYPILLVYLSTLNRVSITILSHVKRFFNQNRR